MKLSYSTTVEDWMAMARHATFSAQFRDDVFVWKWFFAIILGATAAYVFADVSRTVGLGAGCVTLALVAWLYPRWARLGALAAFRRELSTKRHLPLFAAERSLEIRRVGISSAIFASPHRIPGCPITPITSTSPIPGVGVGIDAGITALEGNGVVAGSLGRGDATAPQRLKLAEVLLQDVLPPFRYVALANPGNQPGDVAIGRAARFPPRPGRHWRSRSPIRSTSRVATWTAGQHAGLRGLPRRCSLAQVEAHRSGVTESEA